ncbi:MAG: endonuclease/exonuclease/phosphatase family protein [Chlamydiota bacterium]
MKITLDCFSNNTVNVNSSQNYISFDSITNRCKSVAFRAASYLTDPICKSRECYKMEVVIDELYPVKNGDTIGKIQNLIRKWSLLVGYGLYTALATFTTLPGVALRSLAANLSTEPFLYVAGTAKEKSLPPDNSFSLLSWNVCFVPGGYSITDGGVLSYFYRAEKISEEILRQDADVVCLYETFDTGSAMDLGESLKNSYSHIYFNIAPRSIGTSSGIFIASKFPIKELDVELFPEDTLIGTTKYSAKAVVGFTLETEGKNIARIFTTHAQHGEEPEFPTNDEVLANRRQMQIILEKVKLFADKNLATIVCGDLNVCRENLEAVPGLSLVTSPPMSTDLSTLTFLDGNKENKTPTWDGDDSCAPRFYGKKVSKALELDYTLALVDRVKSINTTVGETYYDPKKITSTALSDHRPLTSIITLK